MTAAPFLKFPAGARLEAMGGTSAAGAQGCEAVFYNPAGIVIGSKSPRSDLGLGYSNLLTGANAGSVAYALSIGRNGTVAGGLVYFAHGGQTAYDAKGDPVGQFSPSDFALSAAYAHAFAGGKVRAGGLIKAIRSSLQSESAGAAAVDLGAQALGLVSLGDGPLDLGVSVSNLGMPMRLGGVSQALPLHLRGGFLWRVNPMLNAAMDGHLPVDDDPYMSLGVELLATVGKAGSAAVRAGYNQAHMRGIDGFAGATAGAGLDLGWLRVDYAWSPYGELGHVNRANLAFRF
ncbi:MAG: PorV/PorQ family protein [Elusimicrobia bacterium]|nr:PorV/PorQ family protein [Elusimicrobiota bacterium]